jgi:probable rRNA maturation factor
METPKKQVSTVPERPALEVELSDTQAHLAVPRAALEELARRVLFREGIARGSLSVALVDDASMRELNRRHLGHDWPTDVISFPMGEPLSADFSGALVISAQMAATITRERDLDPWPELALYLIHGLLHLCGYDDQSAEARARMRRREQEQLAAEGLVNTLPLLDHLDPEAEREKVRWTV